MNPSPICIRSFVALDVETTGFTPGNGDRIVEVAMIRFYDGEATEKFVSLVHPQRAIPRHVTENIHGISDEMVAGAPPFGEILPQMIRFLGDDPMVMHNAKFDLSFLETESESTGGYWPSSEHAIYDTLQLARCSGMFCGSHRLEDLARRIGVIQKFHRAEGDAFAAGKLLLYLITNNAKLMQFDWEPTTR